MKNMQLRMDVILHVLDYVLMRVIADAKGYVPLLAQLLAVTIALVAVNQLMVLSLRIAWIKVTMILVLVLLILEFLVILILLVIAIMVVVDVLVTALMLVMEHVVARAKVLAILPDLQKVVLE